MKNLAIIGGCGHVGLPFGIVCANNGLKVTLVDKDEERTAQVRSGEMPFQERGAKPLLRSALQENRLHVQEDFRSVSEADAIIVTVGTPVDERLDPKVEVFNETIDEVLDYAETGQLLMLRSTLFPGVTRQTERRIRARGLDVELSYCPERIAQGHAIEELSSLPQLVSGCSKSSVSRSETLFKAIGAEVIELRPIEAELGKLFANAYRYLNFAISNQFYMIAQQFDADFNRIYESVTHDYPRMSGFAQSGFAAGPCLLKDTMQLAAFRHNSFALGHAGMMVNQGLPRFVVDQLDDEISLTDKTIGVLGMAFKGNSDDPRDSLAYKLRKILTLKCQEVLCTDPHIEESSFVPLEKVLAEADALIVGAPHDEYRDLAPDQKIVDVFNFIGK